MNAPDSKTTSGLLLKRRFFSSIGWRVAVLGLIGLVLLIPLGMVHGLLGERKQRKAEAVAEIGQQWGGAQQFSGPLLWVPTFRMEERTEQYVVVGKLESRIRKVEHKDALILSPETFEMDVALQPQIRYRGIFRAPVYEAALAATSEWAKGSAESYGLEADTEIIWEDAKVIVSLSDPKGIVYLGIDVVEERLQTKPMQLKDGTEWISFAAPSSEEGERISLPLSVALQGTAAFEFLPVGRTGTVEIRSDWPDPSFGGARLPHSRDVSDTGFSATWKYGEFGRLFPNGWLESSAQARPGVFLRSMSGVELVDPVDGYRLTERSLKYGSLFIGLGFLVFFLFEVLCGLKLHWMHYLLVGAAQALFFLLVLALSEVMPFDVAYGLAATAATGLIAFYAASALAGSKRAFIVGGSMAGLYVVLLVILREQDYALLAGSGLLFVALATLMWLTRKLDWAKAGTGQAKP